MTRSSSFMPKFARFNTVSLGLLTLTLSLAACGSQTPATPSTSTATTTTDPNTVDFGYDGQDHSWTAPDTSLSALALGAGSNTLSYENWTSASNGWGPIEKDQSVGGNAAGDGKPLTLAGKTYAHGFGVHANSSMTFNLGAQCATFTSEIGVDDEVGDRGSVVFQVYGDGSKLYDSGVMTGASATKTLSVSVAGVKELKLVVTDSGNGNTNDHADWATPTLLNCTAGSTPVTPPVTSPAPPSGSVQYSGPIVITKGGTYSGNWESTINKAAVLIQTSEPVTIINSNIRSRGNLISGFNYNLTVLNTRGYALNPNVAGKAAGRAVNAEELLNLDVENSYFEGTTGIYARQFKGNASAGQTIKILRNQFRNTDGRQSDGNGGYLAKWDVVQAVLFNNVQRVPNVEIAWNEIINEPGKSRTEENINFYVSSGTPGSPMRIHDNYIQGAYNLDPVNDSNYPGGGILLGDGLVTDPLNSGFTRVYNNQIVGTTNHGIAIDGGTDNQVYNNRMISSGRLSNGQRIAAANVGVYVWDLNGGSKLATPTFSNNRMADNVIGWTRVAANGTTSNNASWLPDCGLKGTVCSNNQDIGTMTLANEQQEYQSWQAKLSSSNVKIGP
ncbi:NPCBM/NEW2 domain-containing protein (plasmid) [Deinococcus sp. KNUC1210]|uniref:NPCBM/NEW2 domain-containing protein n=1 Tax=Deinococcus sp. KNUC1210 TaxID=2917691 RepID=UPI001EF08E1E|nr:NPCBM/NEW2 domain-containing protein [Deinococcus sp. KNUC1210]ULH17581.1 NPCBM/NEW2 domain-containing protein [Deinococcus sp. KNUC1210]